eukprot:TRINITY_DN21848_c0_g1_i2.p2 TRINITY_DN21848_c0_g1~~TRINITY_DN21848_c0_g1_i2.p2  ORF type:complete len:105 (-),score=32.11 TRINITY_DN21848_c0_g1_i2:262-576(-)
MYSKLKEVHLVGRFTSALSKPVLDIGHCRGESSVQPEEDSEEELNMGVEERASPGQEEALKRLSSVLKEAGLLRNRDSDLDLLRFLKARSFDVSKAMAMYEAML